VEEIKAQGITAHIHQQRLQIHTPKQPSGQKHLLPLHSVPQMGEVPGQESQAAADRGDSRLESYAQAAGDILEPVRTAYR